MAAILDRAGQDVLDVVERVMGLHHKGLRDAEVTIDVLMAKAKQDENGDSTGPALTHQGYTCAACIVPISYKLRVLGLADAIMTIDADNWDILSGLQQEALVHHELTHLVLQTKTDKKTNQEVVVRDEAGRPKLCTRKHDYYVGWFEEVAEDYRAASVEVSQFRQIHERVGQQWLDFGDDAGDEEDDSVHTVEISAGGKTVKMTGRDVKRVAALASHG